MSAEDRARRQLQALTDASIKAEEAEVGLALYLMAEHIKAKHPTATAFTVENSDQGEWMHLHSVTAGDDGLEVDYDDDYLCDLPSHLYDNRRYVWQPYVEHEGGGRHSTRDRLNIQQILDAKDDLMSLAPPVIEILHVRDSDAGCFHTVFVDGVERDDVTIEDVDPGRGYQRSDWDERTADWEGHETPFGRAVHDALVGGADSEYITEPYAPDVAARLARELGNY